MWVGVHMHVSMCKVGHGYMHAVYYCNIIKIESLRTPPSPHPPPPPPHTHTHTIARLESIRHCPTLPQPPLNGYLCTPFSSSPAQGMVQFCCDKGYTLSGVSMATCNQDTGEWEPQTPDCLRKEVIQIIS